MNSVFLIIFNEIFCCFKHITIINFSLPHFVYGEVVAGEAVGQIVFSKNGEEITKSDIVALNDVPKCTWDEKKLFFDIFLNILSFF